MIGRTVCRAEFTDPAGAPMQMRVVACPDGLAFLIERGSDVAAVTCDPATVQQVRQAVTEWLIDAAPEVRAA